MPKAQQVPPEQRGFFWYLGALIGADTLTVLRGIAALTVIPLWAYGTPAQRWLAFFIWALCWLTDALSNAITRSRHDFTRFGKVYDPAIDKIQFYATAFTLNTFHWPLVWSLFGLDVASTLMRGHANSRAIGANEFGKCKTCFAALALAAAALTQLLGVNFPLRAPDGLLLVAVICACFSIYRRLGSI